MINFAWKKLASAWSHGSSPSAIRPAKRMAFTWDTLEDRKVLSHFGGHHGQGPPFFSGTGSTGSGSTGSTTMGSGSTGSTTAGGMGSGSTGSTSSSTLMTAVQALQKDVRAIETNSGTTVGELTAVGTAFQTLRADGLSPTSGSALSTFESGLVKSYASGTTLAGNASLLSSFETQFTSSPTAAQTTDLTTAYNALAKAITSSGITSANLTTIDTDYAAVLAAKGSTSTATFPYITLVTGQGGGYGSGGFGGGSGGGGSGGGGFGGHFH